MIHLFMLLAFAVLGSLGNSDDQWGDREVLAEVLDGYNKLGDSTNYTVENLIKAYGYPVETHKVTTSDGYILTLHRIPNGLTGRKNGKVAYVQHGILSSSSDWCVLGAGKSLAFLLADEGYDVWLANLRGNTWSREHVTMSNTDAAFWNFSWHEMGTIDVPMMIDYVLEQTGVSGVYYVGHSQGTTVYYVMTSVLPEYNDKIIASASLAPIGYVNHMTSPLLQILSYWTGTLDALAGLIGMNEFLPNNDFMKYILGDEVCKTDSISQLLCTNVLFAVCGFSRSQMNATILPVILKYTPAGASVKQLVHFGQEIRSARFRYYDYGMFSNVAKYGSLTPPRYDLSKISATSYLIYSKNDWLSAESDVEKLCSEMGAACAGKILMSDFQFNHVDYLFGIDAPTLVYNKVISLFARH